MSSDRVDSDGSKEPKLGSEKKTFDQEDIGDTGKPQRGAKVPQICMEGLLTS